MVKVRSHIALGWQGLRETDTLKPIDNVTEKG